MKKLTALVVILLALGVAQPAQAEKTITFGENKGKPVKDTNVVTMQNAEKQTELLTSLLEEVKKQNTLLETQNKLLTEQVEDRRKAVATILKGVDMLLQKHNKPGADLQQ